MHVDPRKEHLWLQTLVGEWTHEAEHPSEPGKPPETLTGTESVRSLGGVWTVAEGVTQMPDGESFSSVMTLGYDPQKERFVGTWVGSPIAYLWIYEGELDANARVLTLNAEGPDMQAGDTGKMAKYRDVIELVSDDHRTLTSSALGDDGQWHQFLQIHYYRAT